MAAVFGTTATAAITAAETAVTNFRNKHAADVASSPITAADFNAILDALVTLLAALKVADDTT